MYTKEDITIVKHGKGKRFETKDGKYHSYTDSRDFSYWDGIWSNQGYEYFFISPSQVERAVEILNKYLNPQNN